MTISELIEKLSAYPADAKVELWGDIFQEASLMVLMDNSWAEVLES